jgi:ABC-type multidrug transport system ATPase subunit
MKMQLCSLSRGVGKSMVLDAIDAILEPGELVCAVGANGAGKTTLMKMMATLFAPTAGEILIDGEPLSRRRTDLRAKLHYLSDSPFFLTNNPVTHIYQAALLYGQPPARVKQRIVGWLRQFDLLDKAEQKISTLSRGQKYKVAFIGLLAANPDLWLLDEPFAAGVDPTGISAIKRCIMKACGAGHTVVYSTQIVEIAEQFSDRIWILHDAKLKVDVRSVEFNSDGRSFGLSGTLEQLRLSK